MHVLASGVQFSDVLDFSVDGLPRDFEDLAASKVASRASLGLQVGGVRMDVRRILMDSGVIL